MLKVDNCLENNIFRVHSLVFVTMVLVYASYTHSLHPNFCFCEIIETEILLSQPPERCLTLFLLVEIESQSLCFIFISILANKSSYMT